MSECVVQVILPTSQPPLGLPRDVWVDLRLTPATGQRPPILLSFELVQCVASPAGFAKRWRRDSQGLRPDFLTRVLLPNGRCTLALTVMGLRPQRALHPLCAGAWSGGWRRIAKSQTAVKGFALALMVCLAGSPRGWNSNDADFAALGRVHGDRPWDRRTFRSKTCPGRWIPRSSVAPASVPVRPMILTSTGQTIPALRSRNCLVPSRQLKSINSDRCFRTLVQLRHTFVTYSRRDRAGCLGHQTWANGDPSRSEGVPGTIRFRTGVSGVFEATGPYVSCKTRRPSIGGSA